MSFGQTNGIPQGSVLMNFIDEIVLGYADLELSQKIGTRINDYEILRYRDDYRIFTNNPQDGDLIAKFLTEILVNLGLKLNSQKTFASNQVITNSVKQDKLDWIKSQKRIASLQGQLLFIHDFSYKHSNSGSVNKALDKFFARIKKLNTSRDDVLVLISILVDIMFRNPRFYPIGAAILSKLLSLIDSDDEQIKIINSIINKFKILPNVGYLEIWIQRILLKTDHGIRFDEKICKKLNDANISLWNSDWLDNNQLKKIIAHGSIVAREIIEQMDNVVEEKEVRLFGSKDLYL